MARTRYTTTARAPMSLLFQCQRDLPSPSSKLLLRLPKQRVPIPCQISRHGKAANHFFLAWRTRRASAGCAGPTPRPGRRQRSGGCRTAGRTPRRRRCAPGRRRGGSDAAFLSKITDHWPLFSVSLNKRGVFQYFVCTLYCVVLRYLVEVCACSFYVNIIIACSKSQ